MGHNLYKMQTKYLKLVLTPTKGIYHMKFINTVNNIHIGVQKNMWPNVYLDSYFMYYVP